MLILCPFCNKQSEIKHAERGRTVECLCLKRFVLDDKTVLADYSHIDKPLPEFIGNCKITAQAGKGGMGSVYKGIHPTLGIDVAVKVLPRQYAGNARFRERFLKSSKIAAKLIHPNVVRIYETGTGADGNLYLVMEYVPCGTARELLCAEKRLSPKRTAEIARDTACALEAASAAGIVHRDIKPDNIMIAADGTGKLADLGLAKIDPARLDAPNPEAYMTDRSAFFALGTPAYTAPEQSLDAASCDVRADIYSLGITMYQLLTGVLPFGDADALEMRRRHAEDTPQPIQKLAPEVPAGLAEAVMKCMARDKLERYQTAHELYADLDSFLRGAASSAGNKEKETQKAKTSCGFLPMAALLLAALLTVGCAVFVIIKNWKNQPREERINERTIENDSD